MLKSWKIGVTGLPSSGKSAVCRILSSLGCYVVYSDDIAKNLLKNHSIIEKLVSLFGADIVKEGEIDRSYLANIVFENRDQLTKLEALLHPLIFEEINDQYRKRPEGTLFVVEAPLLFEAKWENFFDAIITIDSKEETCENRYLNMGKPLSDYRRRCKRQWPLSQKKQLSSHIIENNSDLKTLEKETKAVLNQIISLANSIKDKKHP